MTNPMLAIEMRTEIEGLRSTSSWYPKQTNIADICDKFDNQWCALCLRNLPQLTKAHVFPKALRREHNYAHYTVNTILGTIPIRLTVPLAEMCVFLCSACREYEQKIDAVWNNVLYTGFPFSHELVKSEGGPYLKRDQNGVLTLRNIEDEFAPKESIFSKAYVHLTVMSPQPMQVQLAKWKASYFQRLYTTLLFRNVSVRRIRREVRSSRARRRISTVMKRKQPNPILVDWEFSDQVCPDPNKPLNWIQQSARAAVPRTSRPFRMQQDHGFKEHNIFQEGRVIITLVPSTDTFFWFFPLRDRIVAAISNWCWRSILRMSDVERLRRMIQNREGR